jgi:hypothetical protein
MAVGCRGGRPTPMCWGSLRARRTPLDESSKGKCKASLTFDRGYRRHDQPPALGTQQQPVWCSSRCTGPRNFSNRVRRHLFPARAELPARSEGTPPVVQNYP